MRLIGDSSWWGLPGPLLVAEPWLIVADRRLGPAISVVDLHNGTMVTRFGRGGGGPGEIRYPGFLTFTSQDPLTLGVYDSQNSRLMEFALDQLPSVHLIRQVTQSLSRAVEEMLPTDEGLIAGGSFRDAELLLVDSNAQNILDRIGAPPISREDNPGGWVYNGNRYFLVAHPAGEMVGLVYLMQSIVRVRRLDGKRVWTSAGPRAVPPLTAQSPPWRVVHGRAAATERYVYTIYLYREESEHANVPHGPSRIHVFTWTGEFVTELSVDRHLSGIAVSPDDRMLYGAVTEPYPLVGEWRLPQYLRNR